MWDRLTCVTPAAAVVSLAAAKEHLRVDHDDHDELIGELVLAAQAVITGPRGIGYAIAASTWRLSLDAFPCKPRAHGRADEIRIPLDPVTAITSVRYLDTNGVEQTLVAGDDFTTDFDRTPVRIVPAYGKAWPATRPLPGAVKVVFQAGATEAPKDLRQAVLLMIADWYDNPAGKGAISGPVNDILDRYRDRAL